ncbi:tetratricopeptide repeat protein 27 homolog isoform X2 [Phalaenopsis equestris]|uniref:tetratricopeptide repeat protein 27 homolog isoform X2 n=1 Tax=Phalaenopsis equestris TaxID=78828 RepID=UPI0009E4BCA5|nr:tetratricopeptide repeat protein 27 homolog isoform X2 [Phalaenopsis equestris]
MAKSDHGILKSVELRLLRCTISGDLLPSSCSPSPNPENRLDVLTHELLGAIECGDYAAALSSDAARLVFSFVNLWDFEDSTASAAMFYGEVEKSIDAFLSDGAAEEPWLRVLEEGFDANTEHRVAMVLCLGVAALLAFLQQNVTGPVGNFSPFPLLFQHFGEDGNVGNGGEWDSWAWSQLTSVGCDLLGKFSILQYLEYAKVTLMKIKEFCSNSAKTTSWWLCRLFLLQQRVLDDLSSSLYNLLQIFKNEVLSQFGEMKNVVDYWGTMLNEKEAMTIASMGQIEAGILEYHYGRIDSSRLHLAHAAETSGTDISVIGILGYRTIHQVDAKPQLVLITKGQQAKGNRNLESFSQEQNDGQKMLDRQGRLDFESNGQHECDILMAPRLIQDATTVGANGESAIIGKGAVLTLIQQAIVLAQCLHLQRTKRDDELSRWEMAPYIEAVDSQAPSNYIIRISCDILRIRWETTRSRTKQRALLMMDKLVEAIYESVPMAAQRVQLAFCVYTPTISALRKEYGELCVGCGMVGEALNIFEDLELWDNLIYCYRLLDKKAAAVDLINSRLHETPKDPKLWCSLGDVTNNDDFYEKALEISNNKSARAMRSLARSAYNRGDYERAKSLWESAMAVNSLYPDGWFALGAAALKARDINKAIDGFTRAVQLDPENGEAWNNVACLHMINKKSKAAFIAFKEALKFRRNSWQLWENYSHVAVDTGNFYQALEAIKMVLELSSNKRVDIEFLDKILTKTEEYASRSSSSCSATNDQDIRASQEDSAMDCCGDSGNFARVLEERERDLLASMIGTVMQQVIKNGGGGAEIWGLYARWHKMEGNLLMCSEALLRQVRAYQGSELWHNLERFKKFAQASLLFCNVCMEIASSSGNRKELFPAEMHLKNSVKQAINFSDTKEFRDLQTCLDEIRTRLDPPNNVSVL